MKYSQIAGKKSGKKSSKSVKRSSEKFEDNMLSTISTGTKVIMATGLMSAMGNMFQK